MFKSLSRLLKWSFVVGLFNKYSVFFVLGWDNLVVSFICCVLLLDNVGVDCLSVK